MWIARFGRTLTGQVPDGVQPRLAPPRQAGAPATLAGQAPPSWNGGTATNNNAAPDGTSRQAPGTATRSGRSREKAKNNKRQKLLRLVVDQVLVRGWRVEIQLRIPLDEPPPPPDRGLSSKDRLRSLGVEDMDMMGKPVEQRSGHRFRILRCGERLASNSRQGTTRSSSRARAGFPPLAAGLEVIAEVHLAPRLSRGSRQPADPSIVAVSARDSSLRSWSPSQPIRR